VSVFQAELSTCRTKDGLQINIQHILDFLLPVSCGLCSGTTNSHQALCEPCLNELPFIANSCPGCALPSSSTSPCGKCQKQQPSYDQAFALLLYQQPVNILIQQFKFNRKLEYSRLFSKLLAEKLVLFTKPPDLLIPVPLHNSRLRSRGYNQAWELAKHLSKLSGIPASHKLCSRIKKTPLQTGLKASERKRNLKQAFAATGNVKGLHICIVDDVMTTGSTLEAIASVLKAAGTARVSVLVVARAVL
jgi:ComF family protein